MSVSDLRATRFLAGTGYAAAMAVVAAIAAWPIYADLRFGMLAVASVTVAVAIAVASAVWEWRGWLVCVVALGAFVVLGLTLAVPPDGPSPLAIAVALRDLVLGVVLGWKDLVTVDLPVGAYRNLLVPALVVFLGGTLMTALLARRRGRGGAWGAVTGLGMTLFGLLFGRTVPSEPIEIGPVSVPAPREILCGALALVLSLLWLAWRSQDQRRAALRRAADTSGVRVSRRRSASDARRGGLAAAMLAIAVVVAAVAAPPKAAGRQREVLRRGVGPELAISRAVSPLSEYRSNFSDAAFSRRLFTVTALQGALPDRLRIATLSDYDGTVYRVAAGGSADARFTRVPSELPGGDGRVASVRIDIEGLRGIWMPTFGSLRQVSFEGENASALADAFYYDAAAEAGVDTAGGGMAAGDAFAVTANVAPPPALARITAPGTTPSVAVPESVKTWIEQQHVGTDGAALETLVSRLRERGYLSHALAVPADGAAWMRSLGAGYTFQPSASGHSLARIDALFRQLLERQTAAGDRARPASLVAGIGDDEQFAVATALVAEQLGFPARVVVGVRLTGEDQGVPSCAGGVCTSADVTAWTEVLSNGGAWVPVDVTPQHEVGLDDQVTRQRDPENPTDVRPQTAREVVPPDPVQHDADNAATRKPNGFDVAALWDAVRIGGIVLLSLIVVLGPFLVVVAAKTMRRRTRRKTADAAARVVGGWEEYVDTAVDHGLPAPSSETRAELATRYESAGGAQLALAADRAVFSDTALTPEESEEFWRIVDDERHRLSTSSPLWRRALAAVSLRSFTRGLAPRLTRERPRISRGILPATERRGRPSTSAPDDNE